MSAACQHNQGRKKYLRMGKIANHNVLTMRESGCDGVVVKKAYVKQEQFTGGHWVCLLIDGTVTGANPRMVRIGTGPPFDRYIMQIQPILGYFGVISATRPPPFGSRPPPFLHILDPPLLSGDIL